MLLEEVDNDPVLDLFASREEPTSVKDVDTFLDELTVQLRKLDKNDDDTAMDPVIESSPDKLRENAPVEEDVAVAVSAWPEPRPVNGGLPLRIVVEIIVTVVVAPSGKIIVAVVYSLVVVGESAFEKELGEIAPGALVDGLDDTPGPGGELVV